MIPDQAFHLMQGKNIESIRSKIKKLNPNFQHDTLKKIECGISANVELFLNT